MIGSGTAGTDQLYLQATPGIHRRHGRSPEPSLTHESGDYRGAWRSSTKLRSARLVVRTRMRCRTAAPVREKAAPLERDAARKQAQGDHCCAQPGEERPREDPRRPAARVLPRIGRHRQSRLTAACPPPLPSCSAAGQRTGWLTPAGAPADGRCRSGPAPPSAAAESARRTPTVTSRARRREDDGATARTS
jgi:hypothetical protein